jgi:hypothetical protein
MSTLASCAVPVCSGERVAVLEAGMDLRLCARHLRGLRLMCKGKAQLAYAKLAVRESNRLISAGKSRRPGRRPGPYTCGLCVFWHVGHQHVAGDDGVAAAGREAAAAVRSFLSSGQLDMLADAWRHGRAMRPLRLRGV